MRQFETQEFLFHSIWIALHIYSSVHNNNYVVFLNEKKYFFKPWIVNLNNQQIMELCKLSFF